MVEISISDGIMADKTHYQALTIPQFLLTIFFLDLDVFYIKYLLSKSHFRIVLVM